MTSKLSDQFKATKRGIERIEHKRKDVKQDIQGSQADLDKLRKFDLDWNYGPSVGITRLERWMRAEKFGLNPPKDVKELILKHQNDCEYSESVWNTYKIL